MQDNRTIHKRASLYDAFPPTEVRRLVERLAWRDTPKNGSWLNMTESERGVLSSQCLNRRITNRQMLVDEVTAWERSRNKHHVTTDRYFTTANARIKLQRLYPAL